MKQPEVPSLQPAPSENLKKHYLKRLERLVRLRQDFADDLNRLGLDLLEKSIEATYKDCVHSGAEKAAKTLLRRLA